MHFHDYLLIFYLFLPIWLPFFFPLIFDIKKSSFLLGLEVPEFLTYIYRSWFYIVNMDPLLLIVVNVSKF